MTPVSAYIGGARGSGVSYSAGATWQMSLVRGEGRV